MRAGMMIAELEEVEEALGVPEGDYTTRQGCHIVGGQAAGRKASRE